MKQLIMKLVHKDGNKEGNKIKKFDYFQRISRECYHTDCLFLQNKNRFDGRLIGISPGDQAIYNKRIN